MAGAGVGKNADFFVFFVVCSTVAVQVEFACARRVFPGSRARPRSQKAAREKDNSEEAAILFIK